MPCGQYGTWGVFLEEEPVSIVCGCRSFPPIIRMNSANTHLELSTLSSLMRTPPKIMLWKWLFTAMNRPNGMSYRLVLYVVSNVSTSPNHMYWSMHLPDVHIRVLIRLSSSTCTVYLKLGSASSILLKTSSVFTASLSDCSWLIFPQRVFKDIFVNGIRSMLPKKLPIML